MRLVTTLCLLTLATSQVVAQRYTVKPGVRGPEDKRIQERSSGDPLSRTLPKERSKNDTTVEVDLLVSGTTGGGLAAQRWGHTFREIGFAVQIRSARVTDKLGVTERELGRLRRVTVVGSIDDDGSLRFADRRFTATEAAKLKEWLRELQTFGKQGSPDGKPMWGLSKAQFDRLYRGLAIKTTESMVGADFVQAVKAIQVPREYPLRLSEDAKVWLAKPEVRVTTVSNDLTGLSSGATLSIALSEFGLGFRPQRTPEGRIELVVDPLEKGFKAWPTGWPFEGSRPKAMPKMFEFVPVKFEEAPLADVIRTIAVKTELPIHVDYRGVAAKDVVFEELRVSYPYRKTSWSLLLRGVLNPHKLTREYRVDEAGRVFVWVTPFVPKRISSR